MACFLSIFATSNVRKSATPGGDLPRTLSDPRVNLTLAFPNPSRSFDEARNAVLFFGHDGVLEIGFFVEAGALAISGTALLISGMSEAKCLSVFDAARTSILDVAREAYSHERRNYYTLTAADFRWRRSMLIRYARRDPPQPQRRLRIK